MKIILLKELPGKGGEGDVIDVARGYANNYLLRQGFAVLATKGNLKQLEQQRNNIAKREEGRIAQAEELKAALEEKGVVIKAKVGEEGQLFGSVTAQMIAEAVHDERDLTIDRRRVDVRVPIKTVGEHVVAVSLYRDIKADLTVEVVDAEAPEAALEPEAIEDAAEGDDADSPADAGSSDEPAGEEADAE